MPKNQKELRTCHDCGLEAFEDCETQNKHIPGDENFAPCRYCVRNPKKVGWYDFYHEQWTLDTNGDAILDDTPTPHDVEMLKTLRGLTQQEIDLIPVALRVALRMRDRGL